MKESQSTALRVRRCIVRRMDMCGCCSSLPYVERRDGGGWASLTVGQ